MIYRQILAVQPGHAIVLHLLGLLGHQVGRNESAVQLIRQAIALEPEVAAFHSNLGEAHRALGQLEEAIAACRRAIALQSSLPEAHLNLGNALKDKGELGEAITAYRQAIALRSSYPEAHGNLGIALIEKGQLDEAIAALRQAIGLNPSYAEAHNNLGNALREKGQLDEAMAACRRGIALNSQLPQSHASLGTILRGKGLLDEAIDAFHRALQLKPDYVEAHGNLGIVLADKDRFDEAMAAFQRAIQTRPGYVEAYCNLTLLLNAQGKSGPALDLIRQSLKIRETPEARRIFVDCVEHLHWTRDDSEIRHLMVRALTEPWGRPLDLARSGARLLKLNPDIRKCAARATEAWRKGAASKGLFEPDSLAMLRTDPLLRALLTSAPICDLEIEHLLTMARRTLLEAAETNDPFAEADGTLSFYADLARQCFINEYVFLATEEEIRRVDDLRSSLVAALEARSQVPVLWPVAVAAYYPLSSLPKAIRLLDNSRWPEAVTNVLVQQFREPMEEQQERASIPRLTDIEDKVSLLVQEQYEENPYPRWVRTEPARKARYLVDFLSEKFPQVPFKRDVRSSPLEILIAGCGTGQHSIATAQRFLESHLLAVDLSTKSLGYARRKTRELGITSIEYAQADLTKLGVLGRRFDLIESVGVLHCLADPSAGWRTLLSLLRPDGFMRLGFYSEMARREVVKTRALVAERGYKATPDGMRQFREDMMTSDKNAGFAYVLDIRDFFSMSECRDMWFHVQEHLTTLPEIQRFLAENQLLFLGFEIDARTLHLYRCRFPNDPPATNLQQWHIFESENPDTFAGMYQFWIQRMG